jgi:hypothetical protein
MSARALERTIAAILLAVAVWPIAHLVLVARFEVDPWELFGWGMYAAPSPQVQIRLEQLYEGRSLVVRPSDATLEALNEFARLRTRLGRFVSLDATADEVLALEPQMEGVALVLRRWSLDRETARFGYTETRHEYRRQP